MPETPLESLPEDWQAEVTALRRQKDSFRKQFQEHKQKYEEAGELLEAAGSKVSKFQEIEAALAKAVADQSAKDLELSRIKAAHAAKLDIGFASRLQGATPDELKADAESLASQFGGTAPPPAFVDGSQGQSPGGQGPRVEPLNSDSFAEGLSTALMNMGADD